MFTKLDNEYVLCVCGTKIKNTRKYYHKKTSAHKKYVRLHEDDNIYNCLCGSFIKYENQEDHEKTYSHKDIMNSKQLKDVEYKKVVVEDVNKVCKVKPYTCPCGSHVSQYRRRQHEKTKKHLDFLIN